MPKTPDHVRIVINERGWLLLSTTPGEAYNIYPAQSHGTGQEQAKWGIGPIEVARILERLNIRVEVCVERSL